MPGPRTRSRASSLPASPPDAPASSSFSDFASRPAQPSSLSPDFPLSPALELDPEPQPVRDAASVRTQGLPGHAQPFYGSFPVSLPWFNQTDIESSKKLREFLKSCEKFMLVTPGYTGGFFLESDKEYLNDIGITGKTSSELLQSLKARLKASELTSIQTMQQAMEALCQAERHFTKMKYSSFDVWIESFLAARNEFRLHERSLSQFLEKRESKDLRFYLYLMVAVRVPSNIMEMYSTISTDYSYAGLCRHLASLDDDLRGEYTRYWKTNGRILYEPYGFDYEWNSFQNIKKKFASSGSDSLRASTPHRGSNVSKPATRTQSNRTQPDPIQSVHRSPSAHFQKPTAVEDPRLDLQTRGRSNLAFQERGPFRGRKDGGQHIPVDHSRQGQNFKERQDRHARGQDVIHIVDSREERPQNNAVVQNKALAEVFPNGASVIHMGKMKKYTKDDLVNVDVLLRDSRGQVAISTNFGLDSFCTPDGFVGTDFVDLLRDNDIPFEINKVNRVITGFNSKGSRTEWEEVSFRLSPIHHPGLTFECAAVLAPEGSESTRVLGVAFQESEYFRPSSNRICGNRNPDNAEPHVDQILQVAVEDPNILAFPSPNVILATFDGEAEFTVEQLLSNCKSDQDPVVAKRLRDVLKPYAYTFTSRNPKSGTATLPPIRHSFRNDKRARSRPNKFSDPVRAGILNRYFEKKAAEGNFERCEPSTHWINPNLVAKPGHEHELPNDDNMRVVYNCTMVNQTIVPVGFIDESESHQIAKIARATLACTLDIKSGFPSLRYHPETSQHFIVRAPNGWWKPKIALEGDRNLPAIWNAFIYSTLGDAIEYCVVRTDDILILSYHPYYADLPEKLKTVLHRLTAKAGLNLHGLKSAFALRRVKWNGLLIDFTARTIKRDPRNWSGIESYPTPKNLAELSTALGLFQKVAPDVPDFAFHMQPWRTLLSEIPKSWPRKNPSKQHPASLHYLKFYPLTEEQTSGWRSLCKYLASQKGLSLPRQGWVLQAHVDASREIGGASVAWMVHPSEKFLPPEKQDRAFVCYRSYIWSGAEKNWPAGQKELAAVVDLQRALDHCNLCNTTERMLFTDNLNNSFLGGPTANEARLEAKTGMQARLLSEINSFDWTYFDHISGKRNEADAPSRYVYDSTDTCGANLTTYDSEVWGNLDTDSCAYVPRDVDYADVEFVRTDKPHSVVSICCPVIDDLSVPEPSSDVILATGGPKSQRTRSSPDLYSVPVDLLPNLLADNPYFTSLDLTTVVEPFFGLGNMSKCFRSSSPNKIIGVEKDSSRARAIEGTDYVNVIHADVNDLEDNRLKAIEGIGSTILLHPPFKDWHINIANSLRFGNSKSTFIALLPSDSLEPKEKELGIIIVHVLRSITVTFLDATGKSFPTPLSNKVSIYIFKLDQGVVPPDELRFASSIWNGPPGTTFGPDGLWHWQRTSSNTICPPDINQIRIRLFRCAHTGHRSYKQTLHELARSYFWNGMDRDVATWILRCDPCKVSFKNISEALFNATPGTAMAGIEPNEVVAADWCKMFDHYLLIFVDTKTFFMDFAGPFKYANSGQPSADDSARGLALWSARYGPMKTVVTDQGTHFTGASFARKAAELGILHRPTTTSHHPQANGYAERAVRMVKEHTRATLIEHKLKETEAERIYGDVFYSINSKKSADNANIAPLEAMNLRPVTTNLDLATVPESEALFVERLDPIDENFLHKMKVLSAADRDRMNTRRQILKARKQAHLEDLRKMNPLDAVFKPRCYVLVRDPVEGGNPGGVGISPMYRGPYMIAADKGNGDYLLQSIVDDKKTKPANVKDLKWFAPPMNGPTKDMRELAALTNTFLYNIEAFKGVRQVDGKFFLHTLWEGYSDTSWEPLENLWADAPTKVEEYVMDLPSNQKRYKTQLVRTIKNWGGFQEEGGSAE